MDRLELGVHQGDAHQQAAGSNPCTWMNRSSASRHAISSEGGGGTNAAVPGRVPPIQFWLRRNSPGSLSSTAPALQQHAMDFAHQPQAERKAAPQPLKHVIHGRNVVRHLGHILDRDGGFLGRFEQQEVG